MAFYPSREANPSSQKQKLVTNNFLGTLVSSSCANPKIRQITAVRTLKSISLSVVTKTQPKTAEKSSSSPRAAGVYGWAQAKCTLSNLGCFWGCVFVINGTDFLVVVFCCPTGHFVVTSCCPSVPSTTKPGRTYALYFLERIIVYSSLHWIIPDKKPRPIFLFTLTRCFHRIAPAPASLPPLLLPHCPHSHPQRCHCCCPSS